jgi:protein-S-isoprenylcysteine O-methyltransferase Ste14
MIYCEQPSVQAAAGRLSTNREVSTVDQTRQSANENTTDLSQLKREVAGRVLTMVAVLGLTLFLPAGTLRYWQAWVYLVILLIPMTFMLRYLLAHNPELLARRLRFKEREPEQKRILWFGYLIYLAAFLLPGLDRRFGWSPAPVWVVILADITVVLGYALIMRVFKENSYASRIIEVEQKQEVIATGPYAAVRHPMYVGASLMAIFSPLALGSYWALVPALLVIPMLVVRIKNEEAVLIRDLRGYEEYTHRTRYRLIPGIW